MRFDVIDRIVHRTMQLIPGHLSYFLMSHADDNLALMYLVYHMTNLKSFDCSEELRREKA